MAHGPDALACSAVPALPASLEPNAACRRSAGDCLKSAPTMVWLWAVLDVAVAGLLVLTVRLLKKTPEQTVVATLSSPPIPEAL